MNFFKLSFICLLCFFASCEDPEPPMPMPTNFLQEFEFLGTFDETSATEKFGTYALLGKRTNGVFGLNHVLRVPETGLPFLYEARYLAEDEVGGIKPIIGYNSSPSEDGPISDYAGEFSINSLDFEFSDAYWAEGIELTDNPNALQLYEDYVNPLLNNEKLFSLTQGVFPVFTEILPPYKRFLLNKTLTSESNQIDGKIKISFSNPLITWNEMLDNVNGIILIVNGQAVLEEDDGELVIPANLLAELALGDDVQLQMIRGDVRVVEGLNNDLHKIYTIVELDIDGILSE